MSKQRSMRISRTAAALALTVIAALLVVGSCIPQADATVSEPNHLPSHQPKGLRIPRENGTGEMVYILDPDKWPSQGVKAVYLDDMKMHRNTNGFALVISGATYKQYDHWIHVKVDYSHGKNHTGWVKFKTQERDTHFDGLI